MTPILPQVDCSICCILRKPFNDGTSGAPSCFAKWIIKDICALEKRQRGRLSMTSSIIA
ncbi:hypothetical protein B0H19DRAFT_1087409 [Mycena capillaripes]|nr:hypothetical protein B0H19DRAFT_1087409 [Mycena capillaripes]